MDNSESTKTVEELQNRLRTNIESIQLLNHQVNAYQRENLLQKETIEKEMAARQTLQLQLENKIQIINSLTNSSPQTIRRSNSPSKTKQSRTHVINLRHFILYNTSLNFILYFRSG